MLPALLQRLTPSIPRRTSAASIQVVASTLTSLVRYNSSQASSAFPGIAPSSSIPDALDSKDHAASSPVRLAWGEPRAHVGTGPFWGILSPVKSKAATLKSPEEIWQQRETSLKSLASQRPNTAYSGRSVFVQGHDVSGTFAKLRRVLAQNSVIKELRMAERHEKKGDKRRRLKSQRWRRRFAHEVRKKVQLVNEIRARGS